MASGTLALWLCNGFVAFLIIAVLWLRKWRKESFTLSDGWLVLALAFNVLRMVGDYHINKYGTPLSYAVYLATVPPAEAASLNLEVTVDEASGLVLTGKLLVPTRVAITVVIWSLNMALLDVLRSTLLRKTENKQQLLWSMYTILALTFFVTLLSAFIECRPMKLNWKLLPDVDKCSFGTAWIMTYEISNITMDYTLGFVLVFLLLKPKTTRRNRVKLSVLGIWVIWGVIEMIRVIQGELYFDILQNRIVWGSVEVLFDAAVATLPTIYILLKPGSNERQGDAGKELRGDVDASSTVVRLVEEGGPLQGNWPLQSTISWDGSGQWDLSTPADTSMDVQDPALKPIHHLSPLRSPVHNGLPTEVGNRGSWHRISPALRDSFIVRSRPGSRLSSRMEGSQDNLQDALAGWIEMDELDRGSQIGEALSPEPDDGEGRDAGIFVATRIHRVWDDDHRPRIITIPRRARLNRSMA